MAISPMLGRRNLLAPLVLLVMVGEPNVAFVTGLYTPGGFIALYLLYYFAFLVFDAAIAAFRFDLGRLALFTFAFYSVFITGLFHGEIADYALYPDRTLITTLIRVQASLFTIYAFVLINRFLPPPPQGVRLRTSLLLFAAYVLLMSFTGKLGLPIILDTFRAAPAAAAGFLLAGAVALALALRARAPIPGSIPLIKPLALGMFFLALVPGIAPYILLILLQIGASAYLLQNSARRRVPARML